MNIHVRNLHQNLIESDLIRLFAPFGEMRIVEFVRDKLNNRPKGHAFVDMPVESEAQKALLHLDGIIVMGKAIRLSETGFSDEIDIQAYRL